MAMLTRKHFLVKGILLCINHFRKYLRVEAKNYGSCTLCISSWLAFPGKAHITVVWCRLIDVCKGLIRSGQAVLDQLWSDPSKFLSTIGEAICKIEQAQLPLSPTYPPVHINPADHRPTSAVYHLSVTAVYPYSSRLVVSEKGLK